MTRTTRLALLGMALSVTGPALVAGDVEDVTRATLEHVAALNAGDVEAHVRHHLPDKTTFGEGLLKEWASTEQQLADFRATVEAGGTWDVELRHLQVRMFGETAVVTGYLVGTITAWGRVEPVFEQRTAVLVKRDGEWREAHLHSSPFMMEGE